MIQIEKLEWFNFEGALRGMRNPKNSWDRSDSHFLNGCYIGEKDFILAKTLILNGSEHRKFLRQIFVSCDVIAPEYFWRQYETYQIGTTEISTSQMHKLGSRTLTVDDFSVDDKADPRFIYLLAFINAAIEDWKADKTNENWRTMFQIIPSSFLYRRTITLNYEVLSLQYKQRKEDRLIEWIQYLDFMKENLPYPEFFTMEFEEAKNIENVQTKFDKFNFAGEKCECKWENHK